MARITEKQVEGAFSRLSRAMNWPKGPAWVDGKSQVGVAMLTSNHFGWTIEIIDNEGGGVHTPFMTWGNKREAYESMMNMAQAVELFKRG